MTTTAIQFNSNSDLNKFISELRRSIKSPWDITKIQKETTNKSFLKHNSILLCLFFTDTKRKTTRLGRVTLGLFNSYIRVISVDVDKIGLDIANEKASEIQIENSYYQYLVHEFIVLISSLHSFELVKNKDLFIKPDLHQKVEDIRMTRPTAVKDKKTNKILVLERMEIHKVNKKNIAFIPPNNVALLLNVAKRELEISKKIFLEIIHKNISRGSKYKFENKQLSDLYDYFEHIQISVIFSYTAVEALCNIAIPVNYEFEQMNSKGIKEIWNKSAIEKNLKTSDKLKDHLPQILNITTPVNEKFWGRFNLLEEIRNNLIHQKTGDGDMSKSAFQEDFLKDSIFDIIYSAFEVIEYFCNANTKHSFFPMGISNSDIDIKEVDDIEEVFEKFDYN